MLKKLYIILCLVVLSNIAFAINVTWSLSPSNTVRDGLWIYTNHNVLTPVKGSFSISRKLLGSHANGDPYFENVNLVLQVVTHTRDGRRLVHHSRTVTSADFPKNNPTIVLSDVSIHVQPLDLSIEQSGPLNGVYYSGQAVVLEYSTDGGQHFEFPLAKQYIPVSPNGYYASVPINEGSFYNVVQTGKVYIRIGNKLHYICCPNVLSGLFNFSMNLVVNIGEKKLNDFEIGPTIDQNTSIIHYQGVLYLKQGNVIRPFTTPEAFTKHHFKFIYSDVTSINGLIIGESIL